MSPIGKIAVFTSSTAITRVMLDALDNKRNAAILPSELASKAQTRLLEYFDGIRQNFDLPLDWESIRGFQKDVLQLTLQHPVR